MEMTAARVVCIARGIELSHVSIAISSYLDYSSRWTIERAAAHGLKFLVQHFAIQSKTNASTQGPLVMDFAARNGHLDILQWLHEQTALNSCSTRSMDDAAKNGHLHIVQWLHTHRTEGCTVKAMDYAAMQGHLEIVKWLHVNRTEGCTCKAMDLAAQNGHHHILEWLDQHRQEGCTSRAVEYASCEGHLAIVQWLCDYRKLSCTPVAMVKAARCGHLSVLQYLHTTFPDIFKSVGPKLVHAAIANGYVDVMTWLISVLPVAALKCEARPSERVPLADDVEEATPITYSCMDVAAEYGQVTVLQWFLEHIAELPEGVMKMEHNIPKCSAESIAKAAGNGHIHVLHFLAQHDLIEKLSEEAALDAMQAAVEGGHLVCVEWLVERLQAFLSGYRAATTAVMDAAASSGYVDILDFLHKNPSTSTWRVSAKAVNEAARQGILEVLQWIHAYFSLTSEEADAAEPCWTPRSMENAAANGHTHVVKWMVAHRRQSTRGVEAMNAAAYMDHLDIVKFLYTNVRTSCSVVQAQEHAEEGGAEECLEWLLALGPQDRP